RDERRLPDRRRAPRAGGDRGDPGRLLGEPPLCDRRPPLRDPRARARPARRLEALCEIDVPAGPLLAKPGWLVALAETGGMRKGEETAWRRAWCAIRCRGCFT